MGAVSGPDLAIASVSYRRYLANGLRDAFDLPGTPIRLLARAGRNPYVRERRSARRAGG